MSQQQKKNKTKPDQQERGKKPPMKGPQHDQQQQQQQNQNQQQQQQQHQQHQNQQHGGNPRQPNQKSNQQQNPPTQQVQQPLSGSSQTNQQQSGTRRPPMKGTKNQQQAFTSDAGANQGQGQQEQQKQQQGQQKQKQQQGQQKQQQQGQQKQQQQGQQKQQQGQQKQQGQQGQQGQQKQKKQKKQQGQQQQGQQQQGQQQQVQQQQGQQQQGQQQNQQQQQDQQQQQSSTGQNQGSRSNKKQKKPPKSQNDNTAPANANTNTTSNAPANLKDEKIQHQDKKDTTQEANKESSNAQKGDKKTATTYPWQIADKPNPTMVGWARVRQVSAGDTLVLVVSKSAIPIQSPLIFILDGIKAPRVARKFDDKEEDFGYDAREFLRNEIGTQLVFFVIWGAHDAKSRRAYGDIYIGQGSERQSLSQLVIANGWGEVKNGEQQSNLSETEYQKLKSLEEAAKKKGIGKYQTKSGSRKRKLKWTRDPKEREQIFEKYKNKEMDAIVDQVRDGSTIRLELIPDNNLSHEHVIIYMSFAGCTAPFIPFNQQSKNLEEKEKEKKSGKGKKNKNKNKKTEEGVEEKIEEKVEEKTTEKNEKRDIPLFALEAKEHTEARLSGQKVRVKLLLIDNFNNIYGSVKHELGNICVTLLKTGLAEYTHWSAAVLDKSDRELLKSADQEAKTKKIGIWSHKSPNTSSDEYMLCTVTRIVSGDTIGVKVLDEEKEERYTLSSIKAPKLGTKTRPNEENAIEAKEFLRKKLIGKQVQLYREYEKTSTAQAMIDQGLEKQVFATVFVGDENVAVLLVKHGYATVITHKQGQPRSREWDKLIQAEAVAKKKKKEKNTDTNQKKKKTTTTTTTTTTTISTI